MNQGSVSPVDEMAEHFKRITQRLASLERAVNTGLELVDLDARYVNVGGDTMSGALTVNAQVNIGAANHLRFLTYGGGWYMQDSTWIRSVSGKSVYIAAGIFGTEGGVSIGLGGALTAGYLLDVNGGIKGNSNALIAGQIQTSRAATNASWGNASFLANPGATGASCGLHSGGVAGQMLMLNGSPYYRFHGTSTELYPTYASEFLLSSAGDTKQDIEPWPRQREPATAKIRALRVVSFRRKEASFMAEVPKDPEAQKDPSTYPIHQCGPDTCGRAKGEFCGWRANWRRGEVGLIAEEVEQVIPEAVMVDDEGKPEGVSVGTCLAVALAAIQELTARVEALEAQLSHNVQELS
jgi:hypothetical protein